MRHSLAATLVLILSSGAVAAQDDGDRTDDTAPPPETSLRPEPRPETQTPDEADAAQGDTVRESETPVDPAPGETGFVADDNDVDVVESAPPMPDRIAAEDEVLAACRADLRALGATFETVDPIADADDADCGIRSPVRLTGLPGGVSLEPAGEMRCETALALARWTEDYARPAADRLPERGALTAIEQGSTYICRRRNNRAEGKLSEHSFGNAVDVMAFRFETGDPIPVQPREREGTMAEAFQDAVRATACLQFTTVLGPGSDASHNDHLHLDVKDRRGGFRLCQ